MKLKVKKWFLHGMTNNPIGMAINIIMKLALTNTYTEEGRMGDRLFSVQLISLRC